MHSVAKGSVEEIYNLISKKFKSITKDPDKFLNNEAKMSDGILELLQEVYCFTIYKDEANKISSDILPELVLEDLEEEQIWQQIEIRNNIVWPQFLEKSSNFLSMRNDKLEIHFSEKTVERSESGSIEDICEQDEESIEEELEKEYNKKISYDKGEATRNSVSFIRKKQSSVVDDEFFKLAEMKAFLETEDAKEIHRQKGKSVKNEEDDINYFEDNFGDEEEDNFEYKDFFDFDESLEAPNASLLTQKNSDIDQNEKDEEFRDRNELEKEFKETNITIDKNSENQLNVKCNKATRESDSDDEMEKYDNKPKSSFELRQERLNNRIKDYENEVLGEKPWQLKGEIQGTHRPQNSLLEEILEFDATTRPAPIITEETTLRLEDIIKQRIKDQSWDDVVLKIKPLHTPQEYRKQLVLDQEKSKQSLAQIYEKEYRNELEKLNHNGAESAGEEPKEHKEIRNLMVALFVKLDALSNFHFTPKPVAPEPKIITNTLAVNMEEVAPEAISNAKLLAPEEIRKRAKGDILGKSERSKTDKNRDRRHKKQKQKSIHKAIEERDIQKQKMGVQISKKEEQAKLLKSITKHRNVEKVIVSTERASLKSSKAFFSKLQEASVHPRIEKKKKLDVKTLSAKKLKL